MRLNMGTTDRAIRAFVVAPVLVALAVWLGLGTVGGVLAAVVAVVMLGTAAVGSCPLYLPFHFSTRHEAEGSK